MHMEDSCSSFWAIPPLGLGRIVICRKHIQASPALRKLPYLIDIDRSEYIAKYVCSGGWTGRKRFNGAERDESTEQQS